MEINWQKLYQHQLDMNKKWVEIVMDLTQWINKLLVHEEELEEEEDVDAID